MTKFLKITSTIVSSIILSYLISFISEKVNVLEKFTIAITDIDFSDIYYQYRPQPKRDDHIVLVNIGYLDRTQLARLLKIIADNHPKVVGGDLFFAPENDSINIEATQFVSDQIKSMENLILATAYNRREDGTDELAGQSPIIKKFIKQGVVSLNIATDDPEHGTVRSFEPITNINGIQNLSFGFYVGSRWDSSVLINAYEGDMMIKWYGYGGRNQLSDTASVFKTFDWDQIQSGQFDKSDIENKIVLLGFLGTRLGDFAPTDIFYTPLNKKIIGRSLPDMYGLEVHANIVKLIIDKDFIRHSRVADYAFNVLFIVLLTLTLLWIQGRYDRQYSILSKVVLVVYVDLLVVAAIAIFFITDGSVKFLIGDGLFVMLFLPDIYEFMETNVFSRLTKKTPDGVSRRED